MQKKLIALAVSAAVAAPMAASAAPTIYGKLHSSVDYVDTDDSGDSSDFVTGAFRASRLGFKGSENLGGSLKAIWQVETQLNTAQNTSNTSKLALRNTFVGLSGNWGTMLLGRHDTPYKIATGKLDPMADRISDYNNIIGNTSRSSGAIFDARAPQTVAYISPNFNGFHAAAAYIEHKFNNERSTGNVDCDVRTDGSGNPRTDTLGREFCSNDDDDRAFSLMGMWESGNWFASGAYEYHQGANLQTATGQVNQQETVDAGATFKDTNGEYWINAYKLGVGWKPGNWNFALVGEMIDDDFDDSANSRPAGYGAVGYKFGKNVVKVAVAGAGESDGKDCGRDASGNRTRGNCSDSAVNYSIALDHNFSKRTTIYAAYSYMDNDDDGQYGLNAGQQLGDGYRPAGDDDAPYAVSLGIIHKF